MGELDSRHFDDDELVERVNDLFHDWTGSKKMEAAHILAMEQLVSHTVNMALEKRLNAESMATVLSYIFQIGFNMGRQNVVVEVLDDGESDSS